jgi:hypothetical protein
LRTIARLAPRSDPARVFHESRSRVPPAAIRHTHPLVECVALGTMKTSTNAQFLSGNIGYILLWVLGVPIPVLLIIFLLRGCN